MERLKREASDKLGGTPIRQARDGKIRRYAYKVSTHQSLVLDDSVLLQSSPSEEPQ